ncbi:MAG: glycosyltransferase [Clostridia bacterium]|nr:glycosyltransferase [Clostridia bacterium]
MKITMLTIGSTGDVRPYVLLGRELSSRGHEITIASFSAFRGMVENEGLKFFELSGDAEKFISSVMKPNAGGLNYLPQVEKSLKEVAMPLLDGLTDSCAGADAMICTFFGSVFYSIAEKFNIPCVQTHYFPMDPNRDAPIASAPGQRLGSAWNETTYKVGYLLISTLEKKYLTEWRRKNGMQPRKLTTVPDYDINGHYVPVIYAISPMVMPRPTDWNEHIRMSGFWFDDSPCEWQPPEDLKEFMENGEEPVYIGFGSMNSGNMNRTITTVLRSVRASRVRAVVNLGWSGAKLKTTKNVYFADYIPHDWLFPRVKAVVHHGGAGTTAAGLRYGKPTLVIPFGGDQPFWGNRVYEMGCGPKPIRRDVLTVNRLTKALLDLTTRGSYRVAAEELGERLNLEHGTTRAADIVEQEIERWNGGQ